MSSFSGLVPTSSTPNLSRLAGDVFQNISCQRCHWMMHQSRSRRPVSVNDVPVAEAFLFVNSSESFGDDSGVFMKSPCSSLSSSFLGSEQGNGKLSFDTTSTPNASASLPDPKRRLFSWAEGSSPSMSSLPYLESIFNEISEDIGASWKKLGRLLLKRECLLNNIDADFSGVGEKSHQLLLKWKEDKGSAATVQALFQALLQIKRTDVAKKLIKLVPSSLKHLSPLLDSVIETTSRLYNNSYNLNPENLEIEKTLLSKGEKVHVCLQTGTMQRFVLRQVEGEESSFAVRKCLDCNALRQQHKRLRKTEEFLKDLEMKRNMVKDLLGVIKQLQDHLCTQHQVISEQKFSCHNCGQYTIKQDLVQKELTLLHHELQRMIQSNRRISVSGIPADRIYNLATRTYSVCEEHAEMHMQSRNRRSSCQHSEDSADSDDNEIMEGPLMCALNVIMGIRRRRKATQSMKTKKTPGKEKLKLAKSNSNPLSSDSNKLSHRESYFLAQENPVRMPNLYTCGDWSGVPSHKMSSDFKVSANLLAKPGNTSSSSRGKSQHTRSSTVPQVHHSTNAVNINHRSLSVQWLKGLEPEEELDDFII